MSRRSDFRPMMAPVSIVQRPAENEQEMLRLASLWAGLLSAGGLVFLEGDLGMGKTTFTRGVLQTLGHPGAVKSPTYTLVEPYQLGTLSAYHCDLYRLSEPEELDFLGLRDIFTPGNLCLIEWPSRGETWLPVPDLRVQISGSGVGRWLSFAAETARGRAWLERFAELK